MADERWQELVERSEGGNVTRGTMFGSQGLRTGKKYFAIWWQEHLVVKLPPPRLAELVDAGHGQVFEPMPGRAMNGWLLVQPPAEWDPLVAEALAYVAAQPK